MTTEPAAEAPTPEQLAARALAGDSHALDALIQALTTPMFRLAVRMLGDVAAAEDATQEVLVKIVTNLGSFEQRGSLRGWAHTIAVRHVLATRRARAETRALDFDALAELIDAGLAFDRAGSSPTPEDRALIAEIRLSCTQGMLLALDREDRLALVLVDLLGFDAAEAAAIAETTHDALRQRLARARDRLAQFLRQRCGVVEPTARCRCERQVAAKKAVGQARVRLAVLSAGDLEPAVVAQASLELRGAAAVHAAYREGGQLRAPAELGERLRRALPTVLGTDR